MYRSGTSCVSKCIHEMGAFFGPDEDLFPADSYNPGGYYEIRELMHFNRKALGFFGMQHFRIEEIPEDWLEMPGATYLAEDLAELIQKTFDGQARWGWKEPQATVLLPIYRHVLNELDLDPVFVICVRNPLDVFGSQVTHSHLPAIGEAGVGLWLQYTLTALRSSRGASRMVIPYEDFLQDPKPYLLRLVELTPNWHPDAGAVENAMGTIHPEWRVNRIDEAKLAEWPAIVSEVLALGRACASDPEGFSAGAFDARIEQAWLGWKRTRTMVRTPAIPQGIFAVSEDLPEGKTTEMLYLPSGGWQILVAKIPPTSQPSVLIDLYQLPAVIWIRSAKVRGDSGSSEADLRSTVHGSLTEEGPVRRLVQWGWLPLQLMLPTAFEATEIEMEIYVQWNPYALEDVVNTLRGSVAHFWTGQAH